MATRSDRVFLPTPFDALVDDNPHEMTRRLRLGVHTPSGFVELLSVTVEDSLVTSTPFAKSRQGRRELLRQVINHATVELAKLELDRD